MVSGYIALLVSPSLHLTTSAGSVRSGNRNTAEPSVNTRPTKKAILRSTFSGLGNQYAGTLITGVGQLVVTAALGRVGERATGSHYSWTQPGLRPGKPGLRCRRAVSAQPGMATPHVGRGNGIPPGLRSTCPGARCQGIRCLGPGSQCAGTESGAHRNAAAPSATPEVAQNRRRDQGTSALRLSFHSCPNLQLHSRPR